MGPDDDDDVCEHCGSVIPPGTSCECVRDSETRPPSWDDVWDDVREE
jgi:hypothetical protein